MAAKRSPVPAKSAVYFSICASSKAKMEQLSREETLRKEEGFPKDGMAVQDKGEVKGRQCTSTKRR